MPVACNDNGDFAGKNAFSFVFFFACLLLGSEGPQVKKARLCPHLFDKIELLSETDPEVCRPGRSPILTQPRPQPGSSAPGPTVCTTALAKRTATSTNFATVTSQNFQVRASQPLALNSKTGSPECLDRKCQKVETGSTERCRVRTVVYTAVYLGALRPDPPSEPLRVVSLNDVKKTLRRNA